MQPALKNSKKVLDDRATQRSKDKILRAESVNSGAGDILNAGLTWESVCADRTTHGWGDTVKNAFINPPKEGGYATKVLIRSGTELYKFTQSTYHEKNGLKHPQYQTITPWWFTIEPFGNFDVGLRGVLKFAKTVGVSATEYMRLIAAVNPDWGNALDMILQARLKKNVYGFWGEASNQPKGATGRNLVGRIYQMWIPNLTDDHIQFASMDTPEIVAARLNV